MVYCEAVDLMFHILRNNSVKEVTDTGGLHRNPRLPMGDDNVKNRRKQGVKQQTRLGTH